MAPSVIQRIKTTTILFFVCTGWLNLSAASCYAQPEKFIRVAIIHDAAPLHIKVVGAYEIIDPVNGRVLFCGRNLRTTASVYKSGIMMDAKSFDSGRIFIRALDTDCVLIENRKFRNTIELVNKDDTRLLVINRIDLENYIKGVLYHEVSHYWPLEALKAQAIACRTYALYKIEENRLKDYDLTSDIYSQVYGGRLSERYRTNKAVEETVGYVLTYQDKAFVAYYHATCAGHTEDASLLWNINIPPLKGVACDFCQGSPHFRWHAVLSQERIDGALAELGHAKASGIKDAAVLGRDGSGRITGLRIATDKENVTISAKDFRNAVGPNIVRSTNFTITVVNGEAILEGFGWGHGVGLCQWGAYFMAKQGYDYKQILAYYYPQARILLTPGELMIR